MKKFLALILAVLMIAGSAVSVAAFDDVSGKYADAINGLQETGIVAGTSETTFTPDALVTRWQMALFMARAASAITDDADWKDGAKIFTDCTDYLGAIQYCFGRGIIKGVTTTEFAPNNNILFRDGIIMAIRALGYEKEDDGLETSAKKYNKTGAAYWTPYYERAIELGLLENLGNVAVDKALTRAETAQLIYNMIYTPVYAKDGANANNYTLYDVAFGGKAIVEVENSKEAWVVETPGYFFGTVSTLPEDAEEIVIAWNEYDKTTEEYSVVTDEVTFDELTKWGVDVEKIDELFGASLEIINYEVDDQGNADYAEYEYLANFEKAAPVALTHEDVKLTYTDDTKTAVKYAKIGSKTHYENDITKKNTITLYEVADASDDLEEVEYTVIDFKALENLYYDINLYDVDGDNYYEYGYVNFYKMDTYTDPDTKGKETVGDMAGLTEIVYSEDLAEDEVFVYTFDLATKTVNVKSVVEETTGKITAYNEKKNADGDTIGYVTIDGTKYTIEPDVATAIHIDNGFTVTAAATLRTAAADQVGETWEFYALEGKILQFIEEKTEDEVTKYLVIKDFTDFELYDHVVMDAFIDGEDESIKVVKIKANKADKGVKLNELTYGKLAEEIKNLFGIYTYTVDEDGYYTITKADFEYKVSDFVTGNSINFKDGVVKNGKTTGLKEGVDKRNVMLRINSATAIYLLDMTNEKVVPVTAKATGDFVINVAADTMFYADKIGYGTNDENVKDSDITWDHGVASVIYIKATEDDIDTGINVDEYKLIFVQEPITTKEIGTDKGFGLTDADEDVETETSFTKYTFDGNAYILSTFADVDVAYAKEAKNAALGAGVYLLDKEDVIVGGVALKDIKNNNANVIKVTDSAAFGFMMADVKASDIDLYNWGDIRISTTAKTNGIGYIGAYNADGGVVLPFAPDADGGKDTLSSNIQSLKFMEITKEVQDDTVVYGTKTYEAKKDATKSALMSFIDEQADDTITVLFAGNCPAGKTDAGQMIIRFTSLYSPVAGNTLTGIIVDDLLAEDAEDEEDSSTDDSSADDSSADDSSADDSSADDSSADDSSADDSSEIDTTVVEPTFENLGIFARDVYVEKTADEVAVEIKLANNPGVASMGFYVNFDATKFTYKSAAYSGAIFAASEVVINTDKAAEGEIYVSPFAAADKTTANGELVTFTFELADGIEAGEYTIEVAKDESSLGGVFNQAFAEVAYDVANGTVYVY